MFEDEVLLNESSKADCLDVGLRFRMSVWRAKAVSCSVLCVRAW